MLRYSGYSASLASASASASAPLLRVIQVKPFDPSISLPGQTVSFKGPCVSCMEPCEAFILGLRGSEQEKATISEVSCCKGALCLTCAQKEECFCFFCSKHMQDYFPVSRRLQLQDGKMAWSFKVQDLVQFQLSSNYMPFLAYFLFSMSASEKARLRVTWKRLREIGVRRIYRDFFQESCNFLKMICLARHFRRNPQAVQPAQPSLFSLKMMQYVALLTIYKRRRDGEMFGKKEQRIPPEFISFCVRRVVVSEHLLGRQRMFFSEILKRVLSRFLPHELPPLF
jgi:hypothetical protein